MLSQNGGLNISYSGVAEQGYVTPDEKGDIHIQALDSKGAVISETSVSSSLSTLAMPAAGGDGLTAF